MPVLLIAMLMGALLAVTWTPQGPGQVQSDCHIHCVGVGLGPRGHGLHQGDNPNPHNDHAHSDLKQGRAVTPLPAGLWSCAFDRQ